MESFSRVDLDQEKDNNSTTRPLLILMIAISFSFLFILTFNFTVGINNYSDTTTAANVGTNAGHKSEKEAKYFTLSLDDHDRYKVFWSLDYKEKETRIELRLKLK